jgi:hypothetical protein
MYTVEGELSIANFIDNFFKRAPLPDTCGCAPLYCSYPQGTAEVPSVTSSNQPEILLEMRLAYRVCSSGYATAG